MSEPSHKSSAKVFSLAGNCVLGCFFFGYSLGYLNPSEDTLVKVFDVEKYGSRSSMVGLVTGIELCLPSSNAGRSCLRRLFMRPFADDVQQKTVVTVDRFNWIHRMFSWRDYQFLYSVSFSADHRTGSWIQLNACKSYSDLGSDVHQRIHPTCIKGHSWGHESNYNQHWYIRCSVDGIVKPFTMNSGYPMMTLNGKDVVNPDNSYWRWVFIVPVFPCALRTLMLLTVFRDDPPGYYVAIGDKDKVNIIFVIGLISVTRHLPRRTCAGTINES